MPSWTIGDRRELVVVAQSLGGFTAPLACSRVPVSLLVLVAAMVPVPGESPGDWFANTGWAQARRDQAERNGREADDDVDLMEDFFHDVPPEVVSEAFAKEAKRRNPIHRSASHGLSIRGRMCGRSSCSAATIVSFRPISCVES